MQRGRRPIEPGGQREPDPDARRAQGEAIRRTLWGESAGARLEVLRRFEPGLADMIVREAFGGIYSDERIPLTVRSLCTIACLVATGRPRQLESHLHAALRLGIPVPSISALFAHLVFYTGLPLVLDAYHVLAKVVEESAPGEGGG